MIGKNTHTKGALKTKEEAPLIEKNGFTKEAPVTGKNNGLTEEAPVTGKNNGQTREAPFTGRNNSGLTAGAPRIGKNTLTETIRIGRGRGRVTSATDIVQILMAMGIRGLLLSITLLITDL